MDWNKMIFINAFNDEFAKIYKAYTKLKEIGVEKGTFYNYVKYWNKHRGEGRVHMEFNEDGFYCTNYRFNATQDLENYYRTLDLKKVDKRGYITRTVSDD